MSILIKTQDIITYSKCPKRYFFEKERNYPVADKLTNCATFYSPKAFIVLNTIKNVYQYQLRRKTIPTFKYLINRIDVQTRNSLSLYSPEEVYSTNKELLTMLNCWYHDLYLEKYFFNGYTNIPLSLKIEGILLYKDYIDIALINDKVHLFDFKDLSNGQEYQYSISQIYNDFYARILIWAFAKSGNIVPQTFNRYLIYKKTIKLVSCLINQQMIDTINKYINSILYGIKEGSYYPSVNEQCSVCPYRKICSL